MSFQEKIDQEIKNLSLYFLGEALPADWYAGFKVWSVLAEEGNPKAHYNVARCYLLGEGVGQDTRKAESHYLNAIELGDQRSAYMLFEMWSAPNGSKDKVARAEEMLVTALGVEDPRAIKVISERERKEKIREHELQVEAALEEELEIWRELSKKIREKVDRAECISYLMKNRDKEFTWIKYALAAFNLEVSIEKVHKDVQTDIQQAGIFRGTTQYSQTKIVRWKYTIEVVNPSEFIFRGKIGPTNFSVCEIAPGDKKSLTTLDLVDSLMCQHVTIAFSHNASHGGIQIPLVIPINLNQSSRCFIASACLDPGDEVQLTALRKYRDERLLPFFIGRVFVSNYYRFSPSLSTWIHARPKIRSRTRKVLIWLANRMVNK